MKNGKATRPDEIPVEAWKSLGAEGVHPLWSILKKVFKEERESFCTHFSIANISTCYFLVFSC
jgi:hypothetical protein